MIPKPPKKAPIPVLNWIGFLDRYQAAGKMMAGKTRMTIESYPQGNTMSDMLNP